MSGKRRKAASAAGGGGARAKRKRRQRAAGLESDALFLAADSSDSEGAGVALKSRGPAAARARKRAAAPRQQRQRGRDVGPPQSSDDEDGNAAEGNGLFGAEDSDGDLSDYGGGGKAYDDDDDDSDSEGDARETADERRLRMAKDILRRVRAGEDEDEGALSGGEHEGQPSSDDDDEEEEEDPVAARLRARVERERGQLSRPFAARLAAANPGDAALPQARVRVCRGHRLPVTSLALSDGEEAVAFTGSKDGSIVRWDVETGRRTATMAGRHQKKGALPGGHDGGVLALALSSDGNLLASGGDDGHVRLWDARSASLVHTFEGHRQAVTSLAFRRLTGDLYSGSADRTVRVWNSEQRAFVETLFGHQDAVTGLDSLFQHRAVSCGSDRTVRVWKVETESQLLFEPHSSALDCVAMLNEDKFVSGSQDGSLAVWSTRKKRSVHRLSHAHGEGRGITAVAALPLSDVVASGSCDGTVRVWGMPDDSDRLQPLLTAPVAGSVNAMRFSRTGRFLVAGVGQEHRLGRWYRVREGRNGLQVVSLLPPRE